MSTLQNQTNLSNVSAEELQAQALVNCGKIDEAIAIYQQLQPESARIVHLVGLLYALRKGDYDLAISCYERALELQGQDNENSSHILTDLGTAHQNRREFDLALVYHFHALNLRQLSLNVDYKLVARSLLGIANAYWAQKNLSKALDYAQQALLINESINSDNELNVGVNLGILANIYHHCGDDLRALELAQQALILLERCVPADSSSLAPLLNNIGAIQLSAGLFKDALLTFIRVSHICEKTLPEEHPKRIAICNNIERIKEIQQQSGVIVYSPLWAFLAKFFLL